MPIIDQIHVSNGNVVNRGLPSRHGESLEITQQDGD